MCDFPGTDALIHHPFSVWFQSIHYLLISPGGGAGGGGRTGTKASRKGRLFISMFVNNLLLWKYITHQETIQLCLIRLL